jgi:hypothetical protein
VCERDGDGEREREKKREREREREREPLELAVLVFDLSELLGRARTLCERGVNTSLHLLVLKEEPLVVALGITKLCLAAGKLLVSSRKELLQCRELFLQRQRVPCRARGLAQGLRRQVDFAAMLDDRTRGAIR